MKLVNFSLSDYLEFRVHMPSAVIGFMAGLLFTNSHACRAVRPLQTHSMKHASRLARSGAVTRAAPRAGTQIRQERPFGLVLALIIIAGSIIAFAACSAPAKAAVAVTVAGDKPLFIPFASQGWPPPPVLSSCTPEDESCN